MNERIRLKPGMRLTWRQWDNEFVVFDDASGRTHQLGESTACALLLIDEEPAEPVTLAERMSVELSCSPGEVANVLPDIIRQLSSADLIEIRSE
jgi:PqqD family protein of HPr-rel-A system